MNALADIKFRFNPSSSKDHKVLGPLEGEIMAVIWEQGRTTVSAVHKALRERKEIAYTTVMTTMSRLAKKHLLNQDKSSSVYVYSPALAKSEFDRYVITGIINGLFDDYGSTVVDCLVDYIKEHESSTGHQVREALSGEQSKKEEGRMKNEE